MVAVQYRGVTTAVPVDMVVLLGDHVFARRALVVVVVVRSVHVPVVEVVVVFVVGDRHVPARVTVLVLVLRGGVVALGAALVVMPVVCVVQVPVVHEVHMSEMLHARVPALRPVGVTMRDVMGWVDGAGAHLVLLSMACTPTIHA